MTVGRPPLLQLATSPVKRFLAVETSGGILLLAASVLSLVIVNSPLVSLFQEVLAAQVGIAVAGHALNESVHDWINEGLMTIFFFVAGLEIKRELTNGELKDKRKAALPVIAALTGMAVPAVIYLAFNLDVAAKGWAIPMATDIAFALGIVTLAGSRVPPAAKIFLLSLAIADDIGSIVVVALFYSSALSLTWLVATVGGVWLVAYLRRADVRSIPAYVGVGAGLWLCALEAGIPPTLVGVAMGLLAPAQHHPADGHMPTVTERIEHALHPWSSFVILPVFALVNAGLVISGDVVANALTSPVTIGIVLARTLGKLIGITGGVWLVVRLGIAPLPKATTWRHIVGMAVTAGAGFTVSLFVTDLAFRGTAIAEEAKMGILVGTVIAALVGYVILRSSNPAPSDLPAAPNRSSTGAMSEQYEADRFPKPTEARSTPTAI